MKTDSISQRLQRRAITQLLLVSLVLAATVSTEALAGKKEEQVPDLGPAPSWQRFMELGEAAIRADLIDPQSATIEWPYGYNGGWWKPGPFVSRSYGYFTCGLVNAKNRYGGYVGGSYFVVVVRNDSVVFHRMGDASQDFDFTQLGCKGTIQKGMFPSVAALIANQPDPDKPSFGIDTSSVPDGVRVKRVESGSPASKSGIKEGTVIVAVNGISLANMSAEARLQVIRAASGTIVLSLDSGENIGVAKVRRADWNTDVVVALNASLGLTLKRSKGGALVAEVQPGGPAERAGVKVGLLATHLNGLQLDSISQGTFLEVIGSISGKSTLTTLELGDFVLQP